VLCRKNKVCLKVADALEWQGVHAVTKREGLLDTPEASHAISALRYLLDPRDTLAPAELLHLSGEPDWLHNWLSEESLWKGSPPVAPLDSHRAMLPDLTPWETLDLAITASLAETMAFRWGRAEVRLANLDDLRGLANGYEDICMARRKPNPRKAARSHTSPEPLAKSLPEYPAARYISRTDTAKVWRSRKIPFTCERTTRLPQAGST